MVSYKSFINIGLNLRTRGNITILNINSKELEEITRLVIKKYFEICQTKLLTCSTILWEDIKRENIAWLKSIVAAKQSYFSGHRHNEKFARTFGAQCL